MALNDFKFKLNTKVKYKDSICMILGRAQYIVRLYNMYMLQIVDEGIKFDLNMNKSFWQDETDLKEIE